MVKIPGVQKILYLKKNILSTQQLFYRANKKSCLANENSQQKNWLAKKTCLVAQIPKQLTIET